MLGADWNTLWRGSGSLWSGMFRLLWIFARLFLARLLWGVAVHLAHFPSWARTFGIVLALLSIVLVGWTLFGLRRILLVLGTKRLVVVLALIYAAIVVINVLTIPDDRSFPARILVQLRDTTRSVGRAGVGLVRFVIRAPDDFLFAYTGQRRPPALPSGFPMPDPDATPIQAVLEADHVAPTPLYISTPPPSTTPLPGTATPIVTPQATTAERLYVGEHAIVANTGSQPLRARAGPGTDFDVLTRFPEGAYLLVVDGPESREQFVWWKVRGEQGEGWCADRWLVPSK